MSLISRKDVQSLLKMDNLGFVGKGITWFVMQVLGLNTINKKYAPLEDLPTKEFLKESFKSFGINYQIHEEDLKRIPESGPFIIVANHPLGIIDGMLLMKIISDIRPDFKVMGNFLLKRIKPLEEMVIPVNPFETRRESFDSKKGIIESFRHIKDGGCIGIFPAGEVSHYDKETGQYIDIKWIESGLKFIKKAHVPIIPVYFHARNSKLFYLVSKIHPDLQTAMIPKELAKKKKKSVPIRIGKPIAIKQQDSIEDLIEYGTFLRNKVYMLKAFYDIEKRRRLLKKLKFLSFTDMIKSANSDIVKPIIDETPKELILREINQLRDYGQLFQTSTYEVFFAVPEEIPNILNELGRLREITFRQVGEGTNEASDLDKFDQYYKHLFLWDNETETIVGAYRMGMGNEIYKKYGYKGFYMSSLFKFDEEIHPFFRKTIEMGRAFIVEKYQQRPMPLFLLWKGIVHVCLRNPEHKYLLGGVSISDKFSNFSKSLMVEFMRSHYFDSYVAQFIHPKNEFKVKLKDSDKDIFFDAADNDLNKFDKLIDELEPSNLRLPVLIKKYFKQNARVIAFNVDPKFNDSIDGLMYIRISDIPGETIKPVLEELQSETEKKQDKN